MALGEAECGRLLRSLLEYGRGGGAVELSGNERSLYLVLKAQMDKDADIRKKRAETGKLGGDAKAENAKQIVANRSKSSKTVANENVPPSSLPSPPTPPVSNPSPPKEKPPKGGKKKGPTVDEVREYCEQRKNGINPDEFVDFYAARGWKYGPGRPVEDWKAAVRTWEAKRRKERTDEDYWSRL